jgi:hypothetical protein
MERHHRVKVAKATQHAANPMLNRADGWDMPCQPRRNSSINFAMGHIEPISKSKLRPSIEENTGVSLKERALC